MRKFFKLNSLKCTGTHTHNNEKENVTKETKKNENLPTIELNLNSITHTYTRKQNNNKKKWENEPFKIKNLHSSCLHSNGNRK